MPRKAERNGKQYTIDTSNIGRNPKSDPVPESDVADDSDDTTHDDAAEDASDESSDDAE